jgi:formylglycine-generating enzyme required for sulfatase activity
MTRHVLEWPEQGVKMPFRLIPAGVFRMGSRGDETREEPAHLVKIEQPFWLAETPVTQAQFALWTESEGIHHENKFKGHPTHPAENLDWRLAVGYCRWLTGVQADKMPEVPHADWFACLPTEAEWESACRAGTDTEYSSGDGEAALAGVGWYDEDWNSGSTHPVAQKPANKFGLHDLHGNVWEWCHDGWDAAAYRRQIDGDEDPWRSLRAADYATRWEEMVQDSRLRVIRGGSWVGVAGGCRSAFRFGYEPGGRVGCFGFRVCLAPRSGGSPPPQTDPAEAKPGVGDGGRGTRLEWDAPGGAGADGREIDFTEARLPRPENFF